jgi:hypothetical protein
MQGHRCTSKQNLAGLCNNSDSELPQEINAQNGTCQCGLQKLGRKKFVLKLDGFLNKSLKGDWLSFRRGPDGPALDVQGTILNVAPVSTKYLSLVNSSMRKMRPAFARKFMAVAVACAGIAAKPLKVQRRFSFPTGTRENALVGFLPLKW